MYLEMGKKVCENGDILWVEQLSVIVEATIFKMFKIVGEKAHYHVYCTVPMLHDSISR
jgi:hypothetical protein